jgi:hypothetical protein
MWGSEAILNRAGRQVLDMYNCKQSEYIRYKSCECVHVTNRENGRHAISDLTPPWG